MGSRRARRQRIGRGLRVGLRVALGLTLLAALAAPQQAGESWELRVERLVAARAGAVHDALTYEERTADLRAIADELDRLVVDQGLREKDELAALVLAKLKLALGPDGRAGPRATDDHADAVQAAAWLGDTEVSCTVALDRALLARSVGRFDQARELLEDALLDHPNSRIMRPWLEAAVADLARMSGNGEEALERAARGEAGLGDKRGFKGHISARATLLGVRTAVHVDLGQTDEAAKLAAEWETVARSSGNPGIWLAYGVGRANLLLAQEDFLGVQRFVGEMLNDPGLPQPPALLRAQLLLRQGYAEVELEKREPARARTAATTLREALNTPGLDTVDRLRGGTFLCERALEEGSVDEAQRELARARELRATLGSTAWNTPVAIEAELARLGARIALDHGGDAEELARCASELEAAFERYLQHFLDRPVRSEGTGFLHFARQRALLSEWTRVRVSSSQAETERALVDLFRARALGSLSRELAQGELRTPPSPRLARHTLAGPDGLLLVYLFAPERSHAFLVEPTGVRHAELPPEKEIEALADTLALRASQAPKSTEPDALQRELDDLRALGTELGDALLPASFRAALAPDRALVIVGSDLIGTVLFECLPGLDGESWLGLDVALSYLSSVSLGERLAERELNRGAEWSEGFVSAPASDGSRSIVRARLPDHDAVLVTARTPAPAARQRWPELEPLDVLPAQLARVCAAHGEERTRFLGPDTTLAEMRTLDRSSVGVLHIVGHGVRKPDEPSTCLVFGVDEAADGEGLLTSAEVRDLANWPPLVVLTACGAGQGALRVGDEGPHLLGGAFLSGGAAAVILTPFRLDLNASLEHGRALQEALAHGASAATATLAGRRAVVDSALEGPARWAHPYYWALPRANGLAQRSVLRHAPSLRRREQRHETLGRLKWVVIAGALLAVGLARLAWLRARARRYAN